jgi:hypothetical protein
MELEVSPEPTEEQRAAIAAALAEDEPAPLSPWAEAALPKRKESEKP